MPGPGLGTLVVGVIGNPNCGKTTLFNVLTGARQQVGNWPGVTVDRKTGRFRHQDRVVDVVDLPGIYSIDMPIGLTSLDEQIARDYTLSGDADLLINIVDAGNLERNLYLTTQLLEMRVPMIVALNMMDKANDQRLDIDVAALSRDLGCPVVPITASRSQGIEALKDLILLAGASQVLPTVTVGYEAPVEAALSRLIPAVKSLAESAETHRRWFALKLLEGEEFAVKLAGGRFDADINAEIDNIESALGDEIDIIIADGRYGFVHGVVRRSQKRLSAASRSLTDLIDRVVLNRLLGIPIFLAVIYMMFMFTINLGGAFIDVFDGIAGAFLVDGLGLLLTNLGAPGWLVTVVANGVGGGIRVICTFIPIIAFLYLFLSVIEDSGYMARAAFVMDRLMRAVGLPGKSFVPLIVGFGCNVPAIMATRTLEKPRDRIITISMNPFMSCGARLPVYALFAAAFFPSQGQNLVFALYLIGILAAVFTGFLMKSTLLRGHAAPFIMELPPYHMPTLRGVLMRTYERVRTFVVEAGQVIVPMVVVLSVLGALGTDGSFGHENRQSSVLSEVGRALTPVLSPLGVSEDNWSATVGVFTGVLAKEAVVGTLDALYKGLAEDAAGYETDRPFDLGDALGESFATIPANLIEVINSAGDPLGLSIGDVSSLDAAAAEQAVAMGTFGAMTARFDGRIGAIAYLLFILLYTPCAASIAAIRRETSLPWTVFVVGWTTWMAFAVSTLFYQIATFARHPESAATWIAVIVAGFALATGVMRYLGGRGDTGEPAYDEAL